MEEVVSVQASYLEKLQRYDQAFIKWENFLKIQENLFGEPKPQMVMTYKKLS